MKKLFYVTVIFFQLATIVKAGSLEFGLNFGLATPSNKINDIYNTDKLKYGNNQDSIANIIANGLSSGYHLGIQLNMPLNDNFDFKGNLGYNSFPESKITITDPTNGKKLAELSTSTKIIPIAAGLSFYPFKSIISPYITGELSFNYIQTAVEATYFGTQVPIATTPADNRFGFGVGVGTYLSLGLIDLNIEGKYNYLNLIGKETSEKDKYYFTLLVGIVF